MKVLIEECYYCNTSAYTVSISPQEADNLPSWIECTSGYGLYGGGACCAPLGVRIVPDDYVPDTRNAQQKRRKTMKDLISIARQLKDDLYSANRLYARACAHKDIFQALALVDRARKKAVLRAVKATLPHLRGKSSNGAMYARASLLAAARTGQPCFIPDWIRYADRRV